MRGWLAASIALTVAACQPEPTPQQKAAEDAKAVAMVEAAQDRHPPVRPLAPQTITATDIEAHELFGAGCQFGPQGADPVLLSRPKQAIMKLDGRPATFASDPGGPALPLQTWEHYVGKGLSLRIVKFAGEGVQSGQEAMQWPATLTIRDEFDRVVYVSEGALRCGA